MALIPMDKVRANLRVNLPKRLPYARFEKQKMENIAAFNGLSRSGLHFDETERRVLLYTTQKKEKVYVQYPGKESIRENKRYPNDLRPVLQKADGSFTEDMDFKRIWDMIDRVGNQHNADLDILSVLFLRIAYMWEYVRSEEMCLFETVDPQTGKTISSSIEPFIWNRLQLNDDVLETINDRFGDFDKISLEGFLYYNDLLAQNEDCKYRYLHGLKWKPTAGRINNCLSHLTVIAHLRGQIGISKLIDSFQRTGVAPLPQSRFSEACGDLVIQ